MQNGLNLTVTDRIILNSYRSMLDGLADYLGNGFEIVLHSLEDYNASVVKIINGQHTGRKIGAPITDLALTMLTKIKEENLDGHISYESKNKKGRPLRSSTIVVYGERKRPIGLICINFYIDTPLSQSFPFFEIFHKHNFVQAKDALASNVDGSIKQAYDEAFHIVMSDDTISTTLKNKEIIRILYNHGIFQMKDTVVKVAEIMGINKNTVYMHLRNIKEEI